TPQLHATAAAEWPWSRAAESCSAGPGHPAAPQLASLNLSAAPARERRRNQWKRSRQTSCRPLAASESPGIAAESAQGSACTFFSGFAFQSNTKQQVSTPQDHPASAA